MFSEALAGILIGVSVVLGLKLVILYQFHRRGFRLPGEEREQYVKYSPRFEHTGGQEFHDTWTGETVEVDDV